MPVPVEALAALLAWAGLYKFGKWVVVSEKEKQVRCKREAFELYVQTGTENKAFALLSRRAVKAAERQRVRHVKDRARSLGGSFTALGECPQCRCMDVHFIKAVWFGYCIRQCQQCEYEWRQKK